MERKLLLVFALTFLAILLFQPLLKKYGPQPPAEPEKKTQPAAAPGTPTPPQAAEAPTPVKGVTKQAGSETETVIENDLYKITFTNRGGQVKSWILKKFDDDQGKPLELVNLAAAPKFGLPLSLWVYDEGLRSKLNSALYVVSQSGTLKAPADITFEYGDLDVAVVKKFSFDHSYVVRVETSVRYQGSDLAAFLMWPSGLGDEGNPAAYAASQIQYLYSDKVERLAIKKISGGGTLNGPFHWGGVVDQYFAAVFLPQDPPTAAMVTLRNALDLPKVPKNPQETTRVEVLGAGVGNLHGPTVERIFVGPKALDVLESVRVPGAGSHADLRDLVNFGFFGIIARALFIWLKWTFQHMVHNWGWAIAIQTLIINIALLPLRISQMKSMLKMQKVQPQIKSIQEKYKKYSMRDPRKQEMQQEISALYKKEGVNPVGGCLPMLIQLPFLYAYYAMLGVAIDLRHAHWLWIRDLSGPDPWHLLPIGIIITMFLTQRMTPQTGMDPAQQKMMNFMMPVFLGVISWNLAAGLCLYWAESTLIGIVQQVFLNRSSLGQEMREMMEKRARKNKK
ncbi:MAG TPA: membrane protein insertase YidC [Terriglobales bacterium]|nr:membrane protein insertase YidC [Terriglobales bacterium]